MRTQTESMDAETRQSLTQKIVQTLDEGGGQDEEDGSENVEDLLDKVELELEAVHRQLVQREEKEQFLALRIHKYQELLKQQGDHLEELHQRIELYSDDASEDDQRAAEQVHYEEQLQKQTSHREALGKVIDVHLTVLKGIKDCQRTIATLEQKKYELKNVTKKCREFLVMAEEAEREQQLGILGDDDNHDLQMEMAPMVVKDEDSRHETAEATASRAADATEESPDGSGEDEETGLEQAAGALLEEAVDQESGESNDDSDVPLVAPTELTA